MLATRLSQLSIKKSDQNMPTNCRFILLLSQFDKIFEKMLFSRLFSYLDKNQFLSKNQFGFRPNSSIQFAISTIHDKLIKNIANSIYTCCIFLDLSKAFDTVKHTVLLWKLYHYFGIRGTALHLIESYLSNRYLYTNVQGYYSNKLKITTGFLKDLVLDLYCFCFISMTYLLPPNLIPHFMQMILL